MSSSDISCKFCNKLFKFKGNLTRHLKTVHEDKNKFIVRFACKFCGNLFKTKYGVFRHMLKIHNPARCTPTPQEMPEVMTEKVKTKDRVKKNLDEIGCKTTPRERPKVKTKRKAKKVKTEESKVEENPDEIVDAMIIGTGEVEEKKIQLALDQIVDAMKVRFEEVKMQEIPLVSDETVDAMIMGSDEVTEQEIQLVLDEMVDTVNVGSEEMQEILVEIYQTDDATNVESEEVEIQENPIVSDEIVGAVNVGSEEVNVEEIQLALDSIVGASKVRFEGVEAQEDAAEDDSDETGTNSVAGYPCLEEGCDCYLRNRQEFKEHLLSTHEKSLIYNEYELLSYENFLNWKQEFEKLNQIKFIKPCGSRKRKKNGNKIEYFYCFRSFKNRGDGLSRRSKKINSICTAEIRAVISVNGIVKVKICNEHYGHDFSKPVLQLTSEMEE